MKKYEVNKIEMQKNRKPIFLISSNSFWVVSTMQVQR
jgi:hypothetical protein